MTYITVVSGTLLLRHFYGTFFSNLSLELDLELGGIWSRVSYELFSID